MTVEVVEGVDMSLFVDGAHKLATNSSLLLTTAAQWSLWLFDNFCLLFIHLAMPELCWNVSELFRSFSHASPEDNLVGNKFERLVC